MEQGLIAFLSAKGIMLASGAGIALVLGLATKLLPKILAKAVDKRLEKLLNLEDKNDKELVLALVKWAEAKIPEPGQGKEKFALVAGMITKWVPILKNSEDKIARLIEESVLALNSSLKKSFEIPQK